MSQSARIIVLVALLAATHAHAQNGEEREGPYRSRMRIVDDAAPAVSSPAPATGEFATALNARAKGYLAAQAGNTDEAIAQLQTSLDTGVLAPIAAQAVAQDILALLAAAGRHRDVVQTYRRPSINPGINAEVNMAVAQSAVAIGEYELALQANNAALNRDASPLSWRQYKVFILTQLKRYAEAASLAAENLQVNNSDPAPWRHLIELQRAAGHARRAVATAELGYDRGVLRSPRDVTVLAQLYLATGLPDHAATALVQHHKNVTPDVPSLTLLVRAQRGAGSTADALISARQLTELADSPAHLLQQAQLEHELQDAAAVVATLRRALRKNLGRQRGTALLLLGENLVALGALPDARRAFRQASEIGGVYRDALAWLARLDSVVAASAAPGIEPEPETDAIRNAPADTAPVTRERATVNVQQLPRIRFFHASAEATLDTLPDVAKKLQRRVGIGLRRERLSAAGPLRWRADGRALVAGQPTAIELGVPVRTGVPPRGRFENSDLPAWRAAVREYAGDASGLGEAWRQLSADVVAAGHTPGSDARTVVIEAPSPGGGGRFQLQLEILSSP